LWKDNDDLSNVMIYLQGRNNDAHAILDKMYGDISLFVYFIGLLYG